jgi:hypothetical protein
MMTPPIVPVAPEHQGKYPNPEKGVAADSFFRT